MGKQKLKLDHCWLSTILPEGSSLTESPKYHVGSRASKCVDLRTKKFKIKIVVGNVIGNNIRYQERLLFPTKIWAFPPNNRWHHHPHLYHRFLALQFYVRLVRVTEVKLIIKIFEDNCGVFYSTHSYNVHESAI